jgi:hypothetical protein
LFIQKLAEFVYQPNSLLLDTEPERVAKVEARNLGYFGKKKWDLAEFGPNQ